MHVFLTDKGFMIAERRKLVVLNVFIDCLSYGELILFPRRAHCLMRSTPAYSSSPLLVRLVS